MEYTQCGGDVVKALIEVVTVGLQRNRIAESEAVLAAVRVLRPKIKALETFDAWIALKRGQFRDAARMLRTVEAEQSPLPLSKALLACCLFAIGDPGWSITANEVIEENLDADAVSLVKLLSGQPKPADEPQAAEAAAPAAQADLSQFHYLRA
ncbi:HrpB1 family type III secretion system apparatus protein [Burkholderia pyrrocinia]|uniref:HrpB1 family type III secretion system apparatus protein n=1 Tax=Burkholderia pyrrocinia TaxID=60550 RepID=A0A2Z5NDK2_BURPY|nr:HrpB1 family type III secretion system apparatus protein [Burkholderia pyrrocinia]AXF26127.1 HrpB1 family type III secretion system apparatus protein [Burkholderia pyrrocinia]